MILIIGRLHIHADKVAEFQSFAREIITEERLVSGCIGFDILQDVAQTDHFVMMEQWRDRAALDHHLNSAAYARNETKVTGFVAAEPIWDEYEV